MFEYEKKIMLSADEYFAITLPMCKFSPIQTQTNYYFDNDDLSMNKKGITCRIRAKDGKFKTTVKNHNVEHPDCSMEVDLAEKTEYDSQIFNAFDLHLQGKFITYRIVMHKDATCEMVLDQNVYLGHTDFELEIEYFKESEHTAQKLIENVAECLVATGQLKRIDEFMARVGQGRSKSQRFFERLKILK